MRKRLFFSKQIPIFSHISNGNFSSGLELLLLLFAVALSGVAVMLCFQLIIVYELNEYFAKNFIFPLKHFTENDH